MSNFRRMLMMLAQDLPKRESFQYGDEILSQDAYDYALSFGKKVVKDLKKVIEQSENPALLIKRINDWKYLIHSLVDTGYTSWLKGDGSAWIDSGIVPTYDDTLSLKMLVNSIDKQVGFVGCRETGSNTSYTYNQILLRSESNFTTFSFNGGAKTCNINYKGNNLGDIFDVNINVREICPEASRVYTKTYYIFSFNNVGTAYYKTDNSISKVGINDATFVPYYNGSYCMLDINSGVIYENANVVDGEKVGAFDWMLTDKDGQQINMEYTRYISDGLVFQLDCDNGCSSTLWKELTEGIEFINKNNIELDGGVPIFNGNNAYYSDIIKYYDINTHTIEIAFKRTEGSTIGSRFMFDVGGTQANMCISTYNGSTYEFAQANNTSKKSNVSSCSAETNVLITLSANNDKNVENENELSVVKLDKWNGQTTQRIVVGARNSFNTTYTFKGKIYAIRIYNRQLSLEEMQYNQALDRARFADR